jgi:nuclear pore complex protein Nup107
MINIAVPPFATQVIPEAYLQVLDVRHLTTAIFVIEEFQAAGQRDLIAMYAGTLGDHAVER